MTCQLHMSQSCSQGSSCSSCIADYCIQPLSGMCTPCMIARAMHKTSRRRRHCLNPSRLLKTCISHPYLRQDLSLWRNTLTQHRKRHQFLHQHLTHQGQHLSLRLQLHPHLNRHLPQIRQASAAQNGVGHHLISAPKWRIQWTCRRDNRLNRASQKRMDIPVTQT